MTLVFEEFGGILAYLIETRNAGEPRWQSLKLACHPIPCVSARLLQERRVVHVELGAGLDLVLWVCQCAVHKSWVAVGEFKSSMRIVRKPYYVM